MVPNVLIVHPALAVAARLKQLVLSVSNAAVDFAGSLADGLATLRDYSHLDLCLFDLAYSDGDGAELLAAVVEKFPRARMIVVTGFPPEVRAQIDPSLLVFPLPLDDASFVSVCRETLTSLQGRQIAQFQLGARFRSDQWSDWYEAFDTMLKRELYIAVVNAWATPRETGRFRSTTALRAQAAHDHVKSVYQGGDYEGRSFACHEKSDMPNLAELAALGQKIDARTALRILHTVGSVLLFWDVHRYPHPPLDATHVSLSPEGDVRVENCVAPMLPLKSLEIGDLRSIADAVHDLLSPLAPVPLNLRKLLKKLSGHEQVVLETSLGDVVVELYRSQAPRTVANFLAYVDRSAYDGTIFHHVISNFVVQGGCFNRDLTPVAPDPPIPSEAPNGLLNWCGTLAMARNKEDPHSATSEFLINLADNPLLNGGPGSPGYTVFGKIIQGMEVLDRIALAEVAPYGVYIFPVDPIILFHARRIPLLSIPEFLAETQSLDAQLTPAVA
jgi:cyclophilin family peptidyl-prolyl cis-trans isomerase/CheY-like chemotaxis protein